jgi:hypothetical protein
MRRQNASKIVWATMATVFFAWSSPVHAQWTVDNWEFPNRFQAWRGAVHHPCPPERAIGASSLAFGPDGQLLLACEKYPTLLVFPVSSSEPPAVKFLESTVNKVDIEGMSVHAGNLYLVDEDAPSVFMTSASDARQLSRFTIDFSKVAGADFRSTDGNVSNLSSLEGLVVSDEFMGPKGWGNELPPGPYFHLLDERDQTTNGYQATLYFGTISGDKIVVHNRAVGFPLPAAPNASTAYRLPELFENDGVLYALMTSPPSNNPPMNGSYLVVRCDVEAGELRTECDFSKIVADARFAGFNSNFEGACVAKDGRLFLTADNENEPTGGTGVPLLVKSLRTPIIALKPRK